MHEGPTTRVAGPSRTVINCALVRRRAPARTGVHPVLLDEILTTIGERHVVHAAVRGRAGRAPDPGALVGVLVAAAVEPGIAARIGRRLLDLVREGVDFRI